MINEFEFEIINAMWDDVAIYHVLDALMDGLIQATELTNDEKHERLKTFTELFYNSYCIKNNVIEECDFDAIADNLLDDLMEYYKF